MMLPSNQIYAKTMGFILIIPFLISLVSSFNDGVISWFFTFILSILLIICFTFKQEVYLSNDGKKFIKKTRILKFANIEEYPITIFEKIHIKEISNIVTSDSDSGPGTVREVAPSWVVTLVYKYGSLNDGHIIENLSSHKGAVEYANKLSAITNLPVNDSSPQNA